MAKWKAAGQMAVAMREAERQQAEKRLLEEQRLESVKNATTLRSLMRTRNCIEQQSKFCDIRNERWYRNLNEETAEAKLNVQVASCTAYQKQDVKTQGEIINSIEQLESHKEEVRKVEAAIELVRLKDKEMDKEIRELRHKLRLWRLGKVQGNPRPRITAPDYVKLRTQIAEEKLGLQVAENRGLAQEIDHLQRERDMVIEVHSQLKKELEELSKQLSGYVEEAQNTYEQRDLNLRKMEKLREHMSKSITAHNNDAQNIQFKIDVYRRMDDFMTAKNKFRQDEGRERRRETRKQMSQMEKEVQLLGELLKKLQVDLNETQTQVIVNTFMQLQTENYMLFKNISHVREGCHYLQSQIDDVRERVSSTKTRMQRNILENAERKEELKEKIEICSEVAKRKEAEVAMADQVIGTYIKAVKRILKSMKYTPQTIISLAGVRRKIEERNISTFLAEIEFHVNNLHRQYMTIEYKNWLLARRSSYTAVPAEPMPPRETPCPRVVVLPPQLPGDWNEAGDDGDEGQELCSSTSLILPINIVELRNQMQDDSLKSEQCTSDEGQSTDKKLPVGVE